MADIVTKDKRSQIMSRVKSKNTKPELLLRKSLHALGFRFRLHLKTLPGKPDIVLPKYKSVIFVHGCFWHFHNCSRVKIPAENSSYWRKKISNNIERDCIHKEKLESLGWNVFIIWECELLKKNLQTTLSRVALFLQNNNKVNL